MQIVIPMSGFGERFRSAGYTVPKPLIKVDDKPIIEYIVKMFPGETDFIFICNQNHLNQVLTNLLINAVQAIPERGNVTLETGMEAEEVYIRISDTGVGIPEDNLSRLFDPFYTTKEVGEGTGLGLSIVHGLVEKCGGRIEVDSEVEVGTTFTIYLEPSDISEEVIIDG